VLLFRLSPPLYISALIAKITVPNGPVSSAMCFFLPYPPKGPGFFPHIDGIALFSFLPSSQQSSPAFPFCLSSTCGRPANLFFASRHRSRPPRLDAYGPRGAPRLSTSLPFSLPDATPPTYSRGFLRRTRFVLLPKWSRLFHPREQVFSL